MRTARLSPREERRLVQGQIDYILRDLPAATGQRRDFLAKKLDLLRQRSASLPEFCERCGRAISHPDSIRDGLGRTCVHRQGAA